MADLAGLTVLRLREYRTSVQLRAIRLCPHSFTRRSLPQKPIIGHENAIPFILSSQLALSTGLCRRHRCASFRPRGGLRGQVYSSAVYRRGLQHESSWWKTCIYICASFFLAQKTITKVLSPQNCFFQPHEELYNALRKRGIPYEVISEFNQPDILIGVTIELTAPDVSRCTTSLQ
jgi:hypothetical protein